MVRTEPDGQTVNIPSLFVYAMEGRDVVCNAHYWICVRESRMSFRKIRNSLFNEKFEQSEYALGNQCEDYKARLREKLLSFNVRETVPQTDTGDQVEKTKTNG